MADQVSWSILEIVAGVAGTTASVTWFVSRQFAEVRKMFYRVISLHNREDDDRFEAIRDDIHQIHIRNAVKDGEVPPSKKSFPRRRYLVEDAEQNGFGD